MFSQLSLINLVSNDFTEGLSIKYNETIIVLFYYNHSNNNTVWSLASKRTVGITFAECNLADVKIDNNVINKYIKNSKPSKSPFVLVYHDCKPIGYYNQEIKLETIIKYSLNLSCKYSYDPVGNYDDIKNAYVAKRNNIPQTSEISSPRYYSIENIGGVRFAKSN